ncbi:Hypothetical protein D9617_25g061330 [Elsinoe fawcettii]|nr:Hypothetical protein D9617_25g061330 [Elsinoe fawcettii]
MLGTPFRRHTPATQTPELQQDRARNDAKLKSRFERIFEKYNRDFSEVGDEIDLRSGRVVVDNGHLSRMRNERDPGSRASKQFVRAFTQELGTEDHQESRALNNARRQPRTPCALRNAVGPDENNDSEDELQSSPSRHVAEDEGQGATSQPRDNRLSTPQESRPAPTSSSLITTTQAGLSNMNPLDPNSVHSLGQALANQIASFLNQQMTATLVPVRNDPWSFPPLPAHIPEQGRPAASPGIASEGWRSVSPSGGRSLWATGEHDEDEEGFDGRHPARKRRRLNDSIALVRREDIVQSIEDRTIFEDQENGNSNDAGATPARTDGNEDPTRVNYRAIPQTDISFWNGAQHNFQMLAHGYANRGFLKPGECGDAYLRELSEPPAVGGVYDSLGRRVTPELYAEDGRRLLVRPAGSRLRRFTTEEDTLLIKLREKFHLSWPEILRYFPDRTESSISVRYSRSLKFGGHRTGNGAAARRIVELADSVSPGPEELLSVRASSRIGMAAPRPLDELPPNSRSSIRTGKAGKKQSPARSTANEQQNRSKNATSRNEFRFVNYNQDRIPGQTRLGPVRTRATGGPPATTFRDVDEGRRLMNDMRAEGLRRTQEPLLSTAASAKRGRPERIAMSNKDSPAVSGQRGTCATSFGDHPLFADPDVLSDNDLPVDDEIALDSQSSGAEIVEVPSSPPVPVAVPDDDTRLPRREPVVIITRQRPRVNSHSASPAANNGTLLRGANGIPKKRGRPPTRTPAAEEPEISPSAQIELAAMSSTFHLGRSRDHPGKVALIKNHAGRLSLKDMAEKQRLIEELVKNQTLAPETIEQDSEDTEWDVITDAPDMHTPTGTIERTVDETDDNSGGRRSRARPVDSTLAESTPIHETVTQTVCQDKQTVQPSNPAATTLTSAHGSGRAGTTNIDDGERDPLDVPTPLRVSGPVAPVRRMSATSDMSGSQRTPTARGSRSPEIRPFKRPPRKRKSRAKPKPAPEQTQLERSAVMNSRAGTAEAAESAEAAKAAETAANTIQLPSVGTAEAVSTPGTATASGMASTVVRPSSAGTVSTRKSPEPIPSGPAMVEKVQRPQADKAFVSVPRPQLAGTHFPPLPASSTPPPQPRPPPTVYDFPLDPALRDHSPDDLDGQTVLPTPSTSPDDSDTPSNSLFRRPSVPVATPVRPLPKPRKTSSKNEMLRSSVLRRAFSTPQTQRARASSVSSTVSNSSVGSGPVPLHDASDDELG